MSFNWTFSKKLILDPRRRAMYYSKNLRDLTICSRFEYAYKGNWTRFSFGNNCNSFSVSPSSKLQIIWRNSGVEMTQVTNGFYVINGTTLFFTTYRSFQIGQKIKQFENIEIRLPIVHLIHTNGKRKTLLKKMWPLKRPEKHWIIRTKIASLQIIWTISITARASHALINSRIASDANKVIEILFMLQSFFLA